MENLKVKYFNKNNQKNVTEKENTGINIRRKEGHLQKKEIQLCGKGL